MSKACLLPLLGASVPGRKREKCNVSVQPHKLDKDIFWCQANLSVKTVSTTSKD